MTTRYRTRINITLPPELISKTDDFAKMMLVSRSHYIELALKQYMHRQQREWIDEVAHQRRSVLN